MNFISVDTYTLVEECFKCFQIQHCTDQYESPRWKCVQVNFSHVFIDRKLFIANKLTK